MRPVSNSFVIWGPLIATVLSIIEAHFLGFITDSHFGSNISPRAILGMILLTIPITAVAYIIGFFPTIFTALFFSYFSTTSIVRNYLSREKFILLGALAGLVTSSVLFFIAIGFGLSIQFGLFIVFGVILPSSMACGYIEYKTSLKRKCINESDTPSL